MPDAVFGFDLDLVVAGALEGRLRDVRGVVAGVGLGGLVALVAVAGRFGLGDGAHDRSLAGLVHVHALVAVVVHLGAGHGDGEVAGVFLVDVEAVVEVDQFDLTAAEDRAFDGDGVTVIVEGGAVDCCIDGAVAWSLDPDGRTMVLGALPARAATRIEANPNAYRALSTLDRVQRLTDPNLDPELESLAKRGIGAAAPVAGLGDAPAAILLVYPTKTGRPLRPRTVAVLGEVAAKLGLEIQALSAG